MKTTKKMSFGFSAVQSGQKSSTLNAAPTLTANSTVGKFVITSAVSKAMGIAVGDKVMFLNNIAIIEGLIQQKNEDIVAYANEIGVDIDTEAGAKQVLDDLTQWCIAKGQLKYDSKGNPIMESERFTEKDKQAYLDANRMDIVTANREALVEEFGDLSDEELAEQLTTDMVETPKVHACSGAKTATTSNATGIGCQLNFTDTAIWSALKADIEEKDKKNRIFNVLLDQAETIKYNNGKEDIDIVVYPIEFAEDVDPIVRGRKEDADNA